MSALPNLVTLLAAATPIKEYADRDAEHAYEQAADKLRHAAPVLAQALIDAGEALADRLRHGHSDTCDGSDYPCSCGHDHARAVLVRLADIDKDIGA